MTSPVEIAERMIDLACYGVHITKDGKRVDPNDFYATPASIAAELSQPQAEALGILHPTQGTRHRGSGVQWNTFASLDRLGLARESLDGFWYATELGVAVQEARRAK